MILTKKHNVETLNLNLKQANKYVSLILKDDPAKMVLGKFGEIEGKNVFVYGTGHILLFFNEDGFRKILKASKSKRTFSEAALNTEIFLDDLYAGGKGDNFYDPGFNVLDQDSYDIINKVFEFEQKIKITKMIVIERNGLLVRLFDNNDHEMQVGVRHTLLQSVSEIIDIPASDLTYTMQVGRELSPILINRFGIIMPVKLEERV